MTSLWITGLVACAVAMVAVIPKVSGHGYMSRPAGRSSAWRFGYGTPENWMDNELNCGGVGNQWQHNKGKCGVCGDRPQDEIRNNEHANGKYVTGTITGYYNVGEIITVRISLSAYHMGWMEFRLCPLSHPKEEVTQKCLNKNLLQEPGTGVTRFRLEGRGVGLGDSFYRLQLPADLSCRNCVLQWWYKGGNSWGCNAKRCGEGKGPQETFVNCADIRIQGNGTDETTSSTTTTVGPTSTSSTVTTTTVSQTTGVPSNCTCAEEFKFCTCEITPAYSMQPFILEWCCSNCHHGYCPPSICRCKK